MFRNFFLPFSSYKYLLYQLTLREIKARYKQSLIGYAWVLFNPLAQLLVYSFVFSIVFHFPEAGVPYPLFLYAGLLPWTFLQTSLGASAMSLVENAPLLRKVSFPREIIPYSFVIAKLVDLFFSSIIFLLFFLYYHQAFKMTTLMVIPLLVIQLILLNGLSLLLSCANLFYRDIQYLTNLILMLWMYLTPVVYPISLVPQKYRMLYQLNPMVGIIEGYRDALFTGKLDWLSIGWSLLISVIVFSIGYVFFKKSEKVFADIV